MKKSKLIIGFLSLVVFLLTSTNTHAADICSPGKKSSYTKTYCKIRLNSNEALDARLISTLSKQYDLSTDMIEKILSGTMCDSVSETTADEFKELPEAIRNACQTDRKTIGEVFGSGWNVFTDIRNSYQKEKTLRSNAIALKYKFEASEQYWDGKVSGVTNPDDAPFDLIVDLNLIEIVLFGSKAQWMNDVYAFPKDEEEDGGGEAPLDGSKPPEGEGGADTGITSPDEGSATPNEGEGETNIPPDCVPPDDPDADLGDGPGSDHKNPLCGNSVVDILMAETCDDGNTVSGDGCNQYCQLEETGSNDICVDPDAVTFKTPEEAYGNENNGSSSGQSGQSQCPAGTVPKKSSGISGDEATAAAEVPQNPEYPGPYLGGTMKQFGESQRPVCGPGESPIAIDTPNVETENEEGENDLSISSETQYLKDGNGNVRCIPTEFCTSFEKVRAFLFGDDWRENENAKAIEALFCVNITKANRPQSPYQLIEGCVDCHITAMADSLEKALQGNVTPLANTSSAFEISSKWGPNYSFNLDTAIKGKPKNFYSDTGRTAIQKANEKERQSRLDNTGRTPTIPSQSALSLLAQDVYNAEQSKENVKNDTELYQMSSDVISDQEVNSRITPLIQQMRNSFMRIQSKFHEMASSTTIDKIPQCQ